MPRWLILALASAATPAWSAEADLFLPVDAAEAARFASPAAPSSPAGAASTAAPQAPGDRWLVRIDRQRLFATIRALERSGTGASAGERLVLNVAEDLSLDVVAERTQRTLSGHSLSGRVVGMAGSAVTFAVNGEVVLGTVWTRGAIYELTHLKDGVHVFRKVDPSAGLPLGEPLKPEDGGWGETEPVEQDDAAAENVVDVLVVWTPKAEENAQGEGQMRTAIDLAVAWANDAHERSGAEVRLNLVGAEPIDYVEHQHDAGEYASGWDLDNLADSGDGFMDGVHARRDALGADLVSLFTGVGDVLGVAYVGGSFSLVNYHEDVDSAVAAVTFAHELGHNMGLYHDRYQQFTAGGGRSRSFSFGYVNKLAFAADASEEDCWLTVMSYFTRCRDAGFDGQVVPYFSTPKRRYPDDEGAPLGVPKSSDEDGVDGPADAVQRMNQTYRYVANIRSDRGDDGDTIDTATPVVAMSTTFAILTGLDDLDVFRVELPEAGWLRVQTTGSANTFGGLLTEEGEVIAEDDDSGRYENFLIGVALEAGVYFVRVQQHPVDPAEHADYTLVVSFNPQSAPDDHGDGADRATAVAMPSSTDGELQTSSDIDYFRFEVAERGIVRVGTTGEVDVVGTLAPADGAFTLTDDDAGPAANFLITAKPPAGTYVVSVRGFTGDAIGAYALDVSFTSFADEPDDHADSPSGATEIAVGSVGSSIGGELEMPMDRDHFRIAVPAALGPGQLWIEASGRASVKGALFHNGGDELIGEWIYGGGYGELVVGSHVPAGSVVLRVDGVDPLATGPYELNVRFIADQFTIPLFLAHSQPAREGFARIINRSDRDGEVTIHAIDDSGQRFGPVTLSLAAKRTAHFNSEDLEMGNTEKRLSAGVGAGAGDWRLELATDLDIEALAYVRTDDGFLTSMHAAATPRSRDDYEELVATFNPASNRNQVSQLRSINQGPVWYSIALFGTDDRGMFSEWFYAELAPRASYTFTAQEFEASVGGGAGKWRLVTYQGRYPMRMMNLLESPTGHLTNLTSRPASLSAAGHPTLPLFLPPAPPVAHPKRQSFARVISRGGSGDVSIHAVDDSGRRFGPVTLSVPGSGAVHFNSRDLEAGNADKGLSAGIGAGEGDWRLEFDADFEFEALTYIRTDDGFLTSMNTVVPKADDRLEVVFFNPASNRNQVSRLRLVNPAPEPAAITITGMDDAGVAPPGGDITLTLPANAATSITAQQLEAGADHFTGRFGDGEGKWQLFIEADQDVQAMSLLESSGRITNLSSGTAVR